MQDACIEDINRHSHQLAGSISSKMKKVESHQGKQGKGPTYCGWDCLTSLGPQVTEKAEVLQAASNAYTAGHTKRWSHRIKSQYVLRGLKVTGRAAGASHSQCLYSRSDQ
eukprot:1157556-Pelagomonas_calceolata.AAC.9